MGTKKKCSKPPTRYYQWLKPAINEIILSINGVLLVLITGITRAITVAFFDGVFSSQFDDGFHGGNLGSPAAGCEFREFSRKKWWDTTSLFCEPWCRYIYLQNWVILDKCKWRDSSSSTMVGIAYFWFFVANNFSLLDLPFTKAYGGPTIGHSW
jgi:hypothetical protein